MGVGEGVGEAVGDGVGDAVGSELLLELESEMASVLAGLATGVVDFFLHMVNPLEPRARVTRITKVLLLALVNFFDRLFIITFLS